MNLSQIALDVGVNLLKSNSKYFLYHNGSLSTNTKGDPIPMLAIGSAGAISFGLDPFLLETRNLWKCWFYGETEPLASDRWEMGDMSGENLIPLTFERKQVQLDFWIVLLTQTR